MMHVSRRQLISAAPATLLLRAVPAMGASAVVEADQAANTPTPGGVAAGFPSHDPKVAREIVGASHGRIERVRELLAEQPALAKAAWDWGFGDWESALGAASHVGHREIALLLMEYGARPDIFTYAMLGQVDAVKAILAANAGLQRLHGPHGITLMRHAKAGGAAAAGVVAYLEELGDADVGQPAQPLADDRAGIYVGDYSFGSGPEDRFRVQPPRNGGLAIRRGENGDPRNLLFQGDHAFNPVGAAKVVIRFEVEGGAAGTKARAVEVVDGPHRVRAVRAG